MCGDIDTTILTDLVAAAFPGSDANLEDSPLFALDFAAQRISMSKAESSERTSGSENTAFFSRFSRGSRR